MPAAASEPRKKRYEVKNWSEYNGALVSRGDFTFWFSEEVVDAWEHENHAVEDGAKKNGRPFKYCDSPVLSDTGRAWVYAARAGA